MLKIHDNRPFSHDIISALLVSQYNMMAAMFTVPINNPVGLDLFSYVATITDKSFGTLKHFWGIFQLTQAQPLPSPHK